MNVYCKVIRGRIMKKTLLLFTLLLVSVITTACINKFAVEELNNKAVKYMDNGDSETAVCRLKSSLDLDEEFYQTHYNLALAYNALGNFEGAAEEAARVLELEPDFHDAVYVLALAKSELAMQILDKEQDEEGKTAELTIDEMSEFNNKAGEAVELYNKYLVKKVNAEDAEQVNAKIEELNSYIKEFSYKLESAQGASQEEAAEE